MDIVSAFCCIFLLFIVYVGRTLLRDRDAFYYELWCVVSVFADFVCIVGFVSLGLGLGKTLACFVIYVLSCYLFYNWYDKFYMYGKRCAIMHNLVCEFIHSLNLLENNIDTDKSKNSHLLRNPLCLILFKESKSELLDSLDKLFSCDILKSCESYDFISASVIHLTSITDSILDNLISDYNEDKLVDEFILYITLLMILDAFICADIGEMVDTDSLDDLLSKCNELSNLFVKKYKSSEEG